jgi:hypothetical protein
MTKDSSSEPKRLERKTEVVDTSGCSVQLERHVLTYVTSMEVLWQEECPCPDGGTKAVSAHVVPLTSGGHQSRATRPMRPF